MYIFECEVGILRQVLNMKSCYFQQDFKISASKTLNHSPQTGICVRHQSFSTREDTL